MLYFKLEFLRLQDVTQNLEKPCVLDLKLGFQAYNKEKLASQSVKMKETTSASHGIRITGLCVRKTHNFFKKIIALIHFSFT